MAARGAGHHCWRRTPGWRSAVRGDPAKRGNALRV